MTTLAELAPGQRAQCVGMWADISTERYRAVITRTYGEDADHALLFAPELGDFYTATLADVTPKPYLPRAWQPDGQPQEGEWNYYNSILGDMGALTREEIHDFMQDDDPTLRRRWVGEWEPA